MIIIECFIIRMKKDAVVVGQLSTAMSGIVSVSKKVAWPGR